MLKLEKQVAIVTGAGSGIGRATALAFVREGAKVVIADFNLEAAQETVQLIQQQDEANHKQVANGNEPGAGSSTQSAESKTKSAQAVAFKVNVSSAVDAAALVRFTVQQFARLDILVNNAGIGVPGTVLTTSEEDWDRIFAVNVKGIFQCSRFALPHLIERGGGTIVNVSSIAAMVAVVDRAAYGASKGAVLALTKAMAADHVKENIRVNCVCPGTIDTPWVERMVQSYDNPAEARQKMVNRQPVGRLGKVEEIAGAILYLVSPESSFATGSALVIDGGFTSFKLPA